MQEFFQFKQTLRTVSLLKSLSYWEKRDSAPRPQVDQVMILGMVDLYYEESFQSQDYIFEHYRLRDNSYFNVRLIFRRFSVIPIGLYADVNNEKIYCLALKNDGAAGKFCRKLGAELDADAVIKEERVPYINLMDVYLIDSSSFERIF